MPYEMAWYVSELPDLDEVIDPLAGHVQELAPLLVLRSGVLPFLHHRERRHHNRSDKGNPTSILLCQRDRLIS